MFNILHIIHLEAEYMLTFAVVIYNLIGQYYFLWSFHIEREFVMLCGKDTTDTFRHATFDSEEDNLNDQNQG